jgi:HNH endonuclease
MVKYMNFIEELSEKRQRWIESSKENDFEEGIKNLLTELYPYNAHFVYELLQNAEDAQATKVKFVLNSKGLIFLHNGKKQFTEIDIKSITNIGNSPKKDDFNQIGKFGVGFKAVFSYTQSPQIYSGKWSFEIRDLVVPKEIPQITQIANGQSSSTFFWFPFDHPQKTKEAAFEEIKETLLNLPDNVILFLQNIKEISWEINLENKDTGHIKLLPLDHQEDRFVIERKSVGIIKTYWLRFTEEIVIGEVHGVQQKSSVAVAFRLTKEPDKGKFEIDNNVSKGDVSIFFPAEKEVSNLRFFLHAPFSATVARDSIQNRPENNKLRDLLVDLFIKKLHKIKEYELLNHYFLSILPNSDDHLSNFYLPFRDRTTIAFKTENLTPTWKGEYLPAKNLLQSNDEIKNIVNKDNILSCIADDGKVNYDVDWVLSPQRFPRVSAFLETLKIPKWNFETLLKQVSKTFNNQNNSKKFLSVVSDDWLQEFYILLEKAKHETVYTYFHSTEKIENSHIVRLKNGNFGKGQGTYFQTEFVKDSNHKKIAKPEVYNSRLDKSQDGNAKKFLESIGVREFEEKDEILAILEQHYTQQNPRYTKEQNVRHLRKFLDFWGRNKDEVKIFEGYYFLQTEMNNSNSLNLCMPSQIFIDSPIEDTKLSLVEEYLGKSKLWNGYIDEIKPKRDFVSFLKELGVMTSLGDEYKKINWFEQTLKNKSKELSLLFWESMCFTKQDFHQFPYSTIRNQPSTNLSSKLIFDLSHYAWIPDKNGKFRTPQEMSRDMLPDDFVFNNKNGWLSAIGFGINDEKKTHNEEKKQAIIEQELIRKEKLAKEAGFISLRELQDAKEFVKMSPEKKALWEEFNQQEEDKARRRKFYERQREQQNNSDSMKTHNAVSKTDDEDEKGSNTKNQNISDYERTQSVKVRDGQDIFRANVERIENGCRLTGVTNKRFLMASHIKPWRECGDKEKLDGNNGLLLSPHVDRLFDRGWISFKDNGEILCASFEIEEIMEMWSLDVYASVGSFNEEQKGYLAYHRKHIFKING